VNRCRAKIPKTDILYEAVYKTDGGFETVSSILMNGRLELGWNALYFSLSFYELFAVTQARHEPEYLLPTD
jgi:hypothetical protein